MYRDSHQTYRWQLTNKTDFFLPRIFMKLTKNQEFPLSILKGAYITSPVSGVGRYIKDVCVDIQDHQIIIVDDDGNGLQWESLKDWSIQFQGG